MMPRVRSKVHPHCSARTRVTAPSNLTRKARSYASIQSPASGLRKAGPAGDDRWRWILNYPRISFIVLFVGCTYVGGIYFSTKVTTWTLDVLGFQNDLTATREVYASSSRLLNTIAECVNKSSLEYLAGAKLQFEADSKRIQKVIDANDVALTKQRNAVNNCSETFLANLRKQSTLSKANSTLNCFYDSFYDHTPETHAVSSSRALVIAVRTILTTQAVSTASDSISKQQAQLQSQLMEMWNVIDTIKISVEKTLEVTSFNASHELDSLTPILFNSNGNSLLKQSASRLGRLSKITSSSLSTPLTLTSYTGLETMQKAGRTLHKALKFLAELHAGFTHILNTADETWGLLVMRLNATIQQAVSLQEELEYAVQSTTQQINRTTVAVMTSLNQSQKEISDTFDILHEKWQVAVRNMVSKGFAPWQRLGNHFVAELTANQRQSDRMDNSIQRRYILPDRTSNSSLKQEHAKLSYHEFQHPASSSPGIAGDNDDFDIAVLRASLVDIGAIMTQFIFYVDVGRLFLLAADLAVGLITESYSDMPTLDIRGITKVDTIENICEVFLCRHSFSAVCFTLLGKASEMMHVFVTFVIVFSAASFITVGLFLWKRDHNTHCMRAGEMPTSPTTIQQLTRTFFDNVGISGKFVADPLIEIQKYATIINNSLRNDYAALNLDSAVVWRNQSGLHKDLNDNTITTSSLVRMLQDCTGQIGDNWMTDDGDASLSSQCFANTLSNTSAIVSLSSDTEKLSANAPFLTSSTVFLSCFPNHESSLKEREAVVAKLQHDLSCAAEKAVYLSFASWWLFIVILAVNRFIVRMVIKSAGVYWWRFLSANRLQFVGFCQENGDIEASDKLSTAIKRHLRDAKWQIIGRFVCVGFSLLCVMCVIITIFYEVA
ncbi:hypothetical protein Plhal304r1_c047g0128881 [Plasmopara halstedii]